MNVNTFRKLSYGVYVISTWDNKRPTGCTANSCMQITSSPATIAISINHDNYTNQCIVESGKFSVSILSENSDPAIIGNFGFQSGKDVNKFSKVQYQISGGLPVIKDSCGYIVCNVINKMETATHTVFLGEVVDAEVFNDDDAMTYAYYHKVIKGKSPKNAPTYIPEENVTKTSDGKRYVCQVCGHEHEGDMPLDFVCPICGVGSDRFKEL